MRQSEVAYSGEQHDDKACGKRCQPDHHPTPPMMDFIEFYCFTYFMPEKSISHWELAWG